MCSKVSNLKVCTTTCILPHFFWFFWYIVEIAGWMLRDTYIAHFKKWELSEFNKKQLIKFITKWYRRSHNTVFNQTLIYSCLFHKMKYYQNYLTGCHRRNQIQHKIQLPTAPDQRHWPASSHPKGIFNRGLNLILQLLQSPPIFRVGRFHPFIGHEGP